MSYFGNTYDSELIGSVNGSATYTLVPERLTWVLEDNFGQTRPDLFAPLTPENRENINFFNTGPDLLLHFGASNRMNIGARYSRMDYELSTFDSERASGSLAFLHDLSSGSTLSLNGTAERVTYAPAAMATDYDLRSAYLGYDVMGERTTIHARAGANRIDRGDTHQSGGLLRFELTREIATRSHLSFSIGHELADAGSVFGQRGGTISGNTQSLSNTSEPYLNEYIRAGWDIAGRVTRLGLSGGWHRETYEVNSLNDRGRLEAEAHIHREFGSRLSGRATVNYSDEDFRNVAGDSHESNALLGLSWRAGRRLSFEASAERYERCAAGGSGYTENRVWLNLRWGDEFVSGVGAFGNL